MDGDDFSSFLRPRQDSQIRFPRNAVMRKEIVEVRRLDDLFEECLSGVPSPRIFLKIDTQGFDVEVLKGAAGSLPRILALQAEVSFRPIFDGMPEVSETLREARIRGFDVVDLIPVTRERDGLCVIEMDCIMARRMQEPALRRSGPSDRIAVS